MRWWWEAENARLGPRCQPGPLGRICEDIARDIRHQYTIGYVSSNAATAGVYRAVRVVARAQGKSKLVVRTRSGYIAGGDSRSVQEEIPK